MFNRFVRNFLVVSCSIFCFSLISYNSVQRCSENWQGVKLFETELGCKYLNPDLSFTDLEVISPKLEKENIKLEIGKNQLVRVTGINRKTKLSCSSSDSNICKIKPVKNKIGEYCLTGIKDGDASIFIDVNEKRYKCDVNVFHKCKYIVSRVLQKDTCYDDGIYEYKCKICSNISKRSVDKIRHEYRDYVCTRCGNMRTTYDGCIVLNSLDCLNNNIELSGDVVIPEYIQKYGKDFKVVGLDTGLCNGNTSITSIHLPDSIKCIGDYCFNKCTNLKEINMPEGLGYIGYAAFQCCYALRELKLPDSIWFIDNFAFNHNSGLVNKEIRLPDNLEYLGENIHCPAHMFYDCGTDGEFESFSISDSNKYYKVIDGILYTKDGKTLVSIPVGKVFKDGIFEIPKGVENLGELSFSRNKSVKEIVIPDSLAVDSHIGGVESKYYINDGNDLSVGCYGYSGVERYSCYSDNERYQCIDGVLYDKDLSRLIAVPNQYSGDLVVPEGVKYWDREAIWSEEEYFKGMAMNKIKSITIPSSIISIDNGQVEVINDLVDMYNIRVESNSSKYVVNNGYLVCR